MTSPTSPVPPPSSTPSASSPSPAEGTATTPEPPSPIGRWFGVAVAVAALAVIWYGFSTAAMSSGLVGTRGELTISTCDTQFSSGGRASGSHSSKRVRELACEGTFRSSDGEVVDKSARLVLDGNQGGGDGDAIGKIREQDYDRGYEPGYKIDVNRSSDGGLYVTSWLSIANCLCLGFFAMIFLGYSITCVGAGHFPKKGIGPTYSEGTATLPKWATSTESWLWVIGGIGLVLAIVFRVLLMFAGFASLLV